MEVEVVGRQAAVEADIAAWVEVVPESRRAVEPNRRPEVQVEEVEEERTGTPEQEPKPKECTGSVEGLCTAPAGCIAV